MILKEFVIFLQISISFKKAEVWFDKKNKFFKWVPTHKGRRFLMTFVNFYVIF